MQRTWWKSALIILFLGYIFASGLPPRWRPFGDIALFPWGRWTMFVRGSPRHVEIISRGLTVNGVVKNIDLYTLFHYSNHWVYEGHPLRWGLRNLMLSNRNLRRDFCGWALNRINAGDDSSGARITALTLSDGWWSLPPDTTVPPHRVRDIASCRYVQR